MCGCSKNKKPSVPNRRVVSQQSNSTPTVTPSIPPTKNIVQALSNPPVNEMTPERRRIERLQREAIRRSLGK